MPNTKPTPDNKNQSCDLFTPDNRNRNSRKLSAPDNKNQSCDLFTPDNISRKSKELSTPDNKNRSCLMSKKSNNKIRSSTVLSIDTLHCKNRFDDMFRESAKLCKPDIILQETLNKFVKRYVRNPANDVVEFAVKYFQSLQDKRLQIEVEELAKSKPPSVCEDEDGENHIISRTRRQSILSETYSPENDLDMSVIYFKSVEQHKCLFNIIKNILTFRCLEGEDLEEVVGAFYSRDVKADRWVYQEGDEGDHFYVVQDGVFHSFVQYNNKQIRHECQNLEYFGELALLYNTLRTESVKAVTDGRLWVLDRRTFRRICSKNAYKKRKLYESFIESVPLLKTLKSNEKNNLLDVFETQNYVDGQSIYLDGDCADGIYFVESGHVQLCTAGNCEQEMPGESIHKGGFFGELALLSRKRRSESAYVVGHAKVAFLNVEAFERLVGPCKKIMKRNNNYEEELNIIFGSKLNFSNLC